MLLDCSARRFLLQYPSAGGSISCSHEQLVTEHISFAWCSVSAGNTFLTKPKGVTDVSRLSVLWACRTIKYISHKLPYSSEPNPIRWRPTRFLLRG